MKKVYIISYERRQFKGRECVECFSGVLPKFFATIDEAEQEIERDRERMVRMSPKDYTLGRHRIDWGDVIFRYKIDELIRG